MSQLPVIVGFGGINPAGRASFHHAYRRLILDELDSTSRTETLLDLATLTGLATTADGTYLNSDGTPCDAAELAAALEPQLRNSTLIRRIEKAALTSKTSYSTRAHHLTAAITPLSFVCANVRCHKIFLRTGR